MAVQTFLFTSEQTALGDGSFVVKPKRMVDEQWISAERARKMLGFADIDTIYKLIRAKALRGWKPDSKRGNGKYRVLLGSVLDYLAERERAA